MNVTTRKASGHLLILLLSFAVSCFAFNNVYRAPANALYSSGMGDGGKNYYTFLWYVFYGHGAQFKGFAYPYGDNVIYTDNQPLLAWVVAGIRQHTQLTKEQALAIYELVLILNIVFCQYLLYLVLKRCHLPWWYALIFAFVITYHSPQIMRLNMGHYALAYAMFVPLLWLLIDNVLTGDRRWFSLAGTVLVTTFFGFLHPYFLTLGVLFFGGYLLVYQLQHIRQTRQMLLSNLAIWLFVVAPLVIFKLWVNAHDLYGGRVVEPYGMDVYRASFGSIFIPKWLFLSKYFYYQGEGEAPVSFLSLFALVFAVAWLLRAVIKKQWSVIGSPPKVPSILRSVVWSQWALFFLSMGIPILFLCQTFPETFSYLKQFRSVGRYAWGFYYPFMVFTAWLLYQLFSYCSNLGYKKLAWAILALTTIFSAYESILYIRPVQKSIQSNLDNREGYRLVHAENYEQWLEDAGLSVSSFQALLPLPFYNLGSEKYYFRNSHPMTSESWRASLATGLPITTQFAARSSIPNTLKQVQLLAHPLIRKTVIDDYADTTKPLLVVFEHDDYTDLYERNLLNQAKLIVHSKKLSLYSLSLNNLMKQYQDTLAAAWRAVNDTYPKARIYQWQNFDERPDSSGMWQSGSATQRLGPFDLGMFATGDVEEDSISISLWIKATETMYDFPKLHVKAYGMDTTLYECHPGYSYNIYNGFVRVEQRLPVAGLDSVSLSVVGSYIIADNLLIYGFNRHEPAITRTRGEVLYKNFPLDKQ